MRNSIFYNKITVSIICALIALCTSSICWPNTYYVDATGGNDSNAGTATNSAWKTIVKVNASSFSAGDFILFKRGEIWREPLVVSSSGSAGNPITFGAYGTGALPILMASSSKNNPGDWTADAQVNIWFATGFNTDVGSIMVNGDTVLTGKVSSKASLNSQGKFWYNPSDRSVYIYSTSNPATYYNKNIECWWKGTTASRGNIVYAGMQNYIDFQDLELKYGGGNGIQLDNTMGINIRRLTVSYIGGSYLTGTERYGDGIEVWNDGTNITIEYNTVSQTFDECITSQSGRTIPRINQVFQYNKADRCGRGFSFSTNSGSPTVDEIYILHNTFTNSGMGWSAPNVSNGQGIGAMLNCPQVAHGYFQGNTIDNTASGDDPIGQGITISGGKWVVNNNFVRNVHNSGIRVSSGDTLDFYYNLVTNTNNKGAFFITGPSTAQVNIYNNTFYKGSDDDVTFVQLGENGGYEVANVTFKNNILVDISRSAWGGGIVKVADADSSIILDYNLYYKPTPDPQFIYWKGSWYSQNQWSNYQYVSSQDSHSIMGSDPSFINAGSDFNLKANSPAINAGTYVYLNSDYAGNAIQGLPDIGAYEYKVIPRIPSSPGSIKIN